MNPFVVIAIVVGVKVAGQVAKWVLAEMSKDERDAQDKCIKKVDRLWLRAQDGSRESRKLLFDAYFETLRSRNKEALSDLEDLIRIRTKYLRRLDNTFLTKEHERTLRAVVFQLDAAIARIHSYRKGYLAWYRERLEYAQRKGRVPPKEPPEPRLPKGFPARGRTVSVPLARAKSGKAFAQRFVDADGSRAAYQERVAVVDGKGLAGRRGLKKEIPVILMQFEESEPRHYEACFALAALQEVLSEPLVAKVNEVRESTGEAILDWNGVELTLPAGERADPFRAPKKGEDLSVFVTGWRFPFNHIQVSQVPAGTVAKDSSVPVPIFLSGSIRAQVEASAPWLLEGNRQQPRIYPEGEHGGMLLAFDTLALRTSFDEKHGLLSADELVSLDKVPAVDSGVVVSRCFAFEGDRRERTDPLTVGALLEEVTGALTNRRQLAADVQEGRVSDLEAWRSALRDSIRRFQQKGTREATVTEVSETRMGFTFTMGEVVLEDGFSVEAVEIQKGPRLRARGVSSNDHEVDVVAKRGTVLPELPFRCRVIPRAGFPLLAQGSALDAFARQDVVSLDVLRSVIDPKRVRTRICPKSGVSHRPKKRPALAAKQETLPAGKLDASQTEALQALQKADDIFALLGPPGTGKTTWIAEAIDRLLDEQLGARILVVSQSNIAVDNLLERIAQNRRVRAVRLGNPEKVTSDAARDARLDRLVAAYCREIEGPPRSPSLAPLREYWRQLLTRDPRDAEDVVWEACNVFAATCVGIASARSRIQRAAFDLVVIDEAGRATPPEMLLAMNRGKRVVLVGDPFQLPPTVEELLVEGEDGEADEELRRTLGASYFGKLYDALPSTHRSMLRNQYRMDSGISFAVNTLFYDGGLVDGREDRSNDRRLVDAHVEWIDTPSQGRFVPRRGSGGLSLYNDGEIDVVERWLDMANERAEQRGRHGVGVFVLTPYRAQRERTERRLGDGRRWPALRVEVKTVDAVQGQQAPYVLLTTARNGGNVSFVADRNRVNVAMSRAEEGFALIGHRSGLVIEDNIFAKLADLFHNNDPRFRMIHLEDSWRS